jgi:hypothetical protein
MVMATITLEVPDELAQRLEGVGGRLPALLTYALDLAGFPGTLVSGQPSMAWNEVLEFLGKSPEPSEILDFKLSDMAQDRVEELLELNSMGTLTPQEADELDTFVQIDHLFIMLKAHLRQTGYERPGSPR